MSTGHDVVIAQALAASSPGERHDILAAALQRYGPDLLASLIVAAAAEDAEEAEMQLLVEAGELFADWIDAEQITGSAEEAERRLVSVDAMAELLTDHDPLAAAGAAMARAEALLALPLQHPHRDVAAAEALAEEARQLAHGAGHEEGQVGALLVLIELPDQDLATFERRVRQGRALRTHRRLFGLRAAQLALFHATTAQQQGKASEPRSWLSLAGSLLAPLRRRWRANADLTEAERSVLSHYLYARGNLRESAELAQAGEAGLPAQLRAAQAWARLGDPVRTEATLRGVVRPLLESYVSAGAAEEVARRGSALREAAPTLAWALAKEGRWSEAFAILETSKSARLHFRRALRGSPFGRRALELERSLHASSRGVPVRLDDLGLEAADDPIGQQVLLGTRLEEAYRQARAELPFDALPSPEASQLAAALRPDEAAVVFGVSPVATTLFLVGADEENAPSACEVIEGWTDERWLELVLGEAERGWLAALAGLPGIDRARVVDELLRDVDGALGPVLDRLLDSVPGSGLVLIPHAVLHLVPLWALPCLDGRDVLICPSALHFLTAREAPPSTRHEALCVTDPTGDLPLSSLEAVAIKRHLNDVRHLPRATEREVREALPDSWLVHISGHGRLDIGEPEAAGLLLAPTEEQRGLADSAASIGADQKLRWVVGRQRWEVAEVMGAGRVTRRTIANRMDVRLEAGPTETLWVQFEDGDVRLVGQVWSAGDIEVVQDLDGAAVAFLSACESAVGSSGDVEESAGLLSALMLAGVPTVIGTLWPVTEQLAAIAVDLFFEAFACTADPPDAGRLVADLRRRLRVLDREEACSRLRRLASECPDARVRFMAEARTAHIVRGPRYPFAATLDWASFFAAGSGTVRRVVGASA